MITIKKAKVNKVGYMEIEYTETKKVDKEEITVQHIVTCQYFPHQDLRDQFAKLREFMVELCDQKAPALDMFSDADEDIADEVKDTALSEYMVTGFSIGGSDEHEGVTLIGRKKLPNNKVLNLTSPFTKWEDEENGYAKAYELGAVINACKAEVEEYLVNFKMAPQEQLKLEFSSTEDPI